MSDRVPLGRAHVVDVTLGVFAVALAAPLYLDFFDGPSFLLGFGVTVFVATGLAVLCAMCGWSGAARLGLAAIGFVVVTVPVALFDTVHRGLPSVRTASELGLGVVSGWARMLSVSLPATANDELVVALLLITWLAGYVTATLALATTSPVWPASAPLVAFGIGLIMIATEPDTHLELTLAELVVLLVLVLFRARRTTARAARADTSGPSRVPRRQRASIRAVAASMAVGSVAVVVGMLVATSGALGNGSHRADPRPLDSQRIRTPEFLTPLATVEPQVLQNPPRNLFTVTIPDGTRQLPGIATATLDRFNGTVWTTGDEFLAAGRKLAADRELTGLHSVTAHVAIENSPSPFIPVIGWPRNVRFDAGQPAELGFSAASGSMITATPLAAGTSYDVVGQLRVAQDLTQSVRPSATPLDRADATLPTGAPPFLATLTHLLTDSDPSPVGKLAAIDEYLRGLPYNVNAAPGHSYADILRVVTATRSNDDGDAEQHAAAFAVMAREIGLPARVVVGYRLQGRHGDTFDVTTRDATAWAEVHFAGYGWIAYDPTDVDRKQRAAPPEVGATPTPTPAPTHRASVPLATTTTTPYRQPPPLPPPGWDAVDYLLAGGTVLVALVFLAGLAVVVEKASRRYLRRHARSRPERVVGAWQESLDRLTELKLPLLPGLTPTEYARYVRETLGGRANPLVELAGPVTTAIFGPDGITDVDAIHAWQLERTLRRGLYPGWRRTRLPVRWLSPRPLSARRQGRRSRP